MDFLRQFLTGTSKKMMVFAAASTLVIFKDFFGFSPDQLQALQVLAASYLAAQGIADFSKSATQIKIEAESKK